MGKKSAGPRHLEAYHPSQKKLRKKVVRFSRQGKRSLGRKTRLSARKFFDEHGFRALGVRKMIAQPERKGRKSVSVLKELALRRNGSPYWRSS
jgi:hypothetical protein